MIDTRFETTIDLRGEIENYRQVALIKYYKILLELDPPSGQADHARRHSLYRQARKTFPRAKTSTKRQEENASRRNSRLALSETQPTLPKSRTIRHRVHSVPRRPRRNLRHTRGTGRARTIRSLPPGSPQKANRNARGRRKRIRTTGLRSRSR